MKFVNGEWIADEGSSESKSLNAIATRQQKISKPQPKIKKSIDDIHNEIAQHEIYGYALRLYQYVHEMMEMTHLKNRPIFRNRQGSFHKFNQKTNMGHIVFGYASLQRVYNERFCEYKSVQYVWRKNGYNLHNEKQGIWQLVLHEMAHNLQWLEDGRQYGSVHNQCFCDKLNELIILFPYDEVKNI